MIGILAGLIGALVAVPGFRLIVAALPLGELAGAATLDWTLFASAMLCAVVAATLVASVPAAAMWSPGASSQIASQRTGGVSGRGGMLERGLVVSQVALVLILISAAALMIRSVDNLRSIETGIDAERAAVIDILLPGTGDAAGLPGRMRRILEAVTTVPGVESAAATQKLPLRGSGHNWGIMVEGNPDPASAITAFRTVTEDYHRTLGIDVLSGRPFQASDADPAAAEGVVLVNQALADSFFPGVDPIGQRIAYTDSRWNRIVGVVANVPENELSPLPVPTRYLLYDHVPMVYVPAQTIVLRVAGARDPALLLDDVRRAINNADPEVGVRETTTMSNVLNRALGSTRQVMPLLSILGFLGLGLGTIGVYGTVSHFVHRRWRDWGIRIALGMRPFRLIRQIVAGGLAVVAAGIGLGLLGFVFLSRLLISLLYEVRPMDPTTMLVAVVLLATVGAAAAYVPARRAARIDPMLALRDS
ncbi:MAG: FtsX-like permease family protein [Gemmatimonas sp.]|nr:FtsX-like permease family protein [Gemmatimonas sp.]